MKVTTALWRAYAFENLEGKLRLRWTCPETGKRKNLALGLNDSISGRGEAARIKAWIEADVDRGAIDGFLLVCRKIKPDTAKQRIWLLKAAWDWGRDKFQLPDLNPWEGVAERFKSVPIPIIIGFWDSN